MDNRFGLKDFVVVALLLLLGVSIWLTMVQRDRQFVVFRAVAERIDELNRRVEQISSAEAGLALELSELRRTLESGVAPVASPEAASRRSSPEQLDESWARSGVPIEWQPEPSYATDPRTQPGFRVGGEFIELFEAQPAKIVPYISTDTYGRRVIDRVAETLGNYDPKTLRLQGLLAKAWQFDPEGTWLRVHLNPRASFSDGTPVTAEDVRWTVEDFIFNPLIEAERTRSTMDHIEAVEVIDDRTVEFRFRQPIFTNLSYTLGLYVLPKHFYSRFEPSQINQATGLLMGSGPYRLASNDPDRQWAPPADVVLVRNDRYWAANARGPLASMRFKTVNDETARLVSYRKGEGSMMLPSAAQFNAVVREPGWDENNQSLNWNNMRSPYSFIGWQCGPRAGKKPTPFQDKRVRQAMTLLIDRDRMIRDVWDGIGSVAVSPVNPDSPIADPTLKPWPVDPERAKSLLAEAGWIDRNNDGVLENEAGEPFEFELTRASGGETAERLAKYLRDACARVGIRCNVRVVDWSVYTEILKSRDFDAITMAWGANAPESDPRQIFHSDSIREGGDNFVQWRSAAGDSAIDRGRAEMDFDERVKIWHEFHRVLHEEQPYTFVRVAPWLRFVKRDFANVHTYATGLEPWEFFAPGASAPTPGS